MVAKSTKPGFTIIEVTLFFAVTGLLFVTLMAGIGVNVRRERYNDSVNNMREILQDQYSQAANTQNSHAKQQCIKGSNNTVQIDTSSTSGKEDTGRSPACDVYGRVISFPANSTTFTAYNVLGTDYSTVSNTSNDNISVLSSLYLSRDTASKQSLELTWGAWPSRAVSTANEGKFSNNPFSDDGPNTILIVRSPLSGSLMTFIGHQDLGTQSSSDPINLSSLINTTASQQALNICVMSSDIFSGRARAINVAANASNANGVSIAPLDAAVTIGNTVVPRVECS
ncbi:hypothetical protein FWF48_01900 [Candidatus Saccharibacteria bacterium]|nr:hypothetical protein [Candidatus Saccharibacteria bacterium]